MAGKKNKSLFCILVCLLRGNVPFLRSFFRLFPPDNLKRIHSQGLEAKGHKEFSKHLRSILRSNLIPFSVLYSSGCKSKANIAGTNEAIFWPLNNTLVRRALRAAQEDKRGGIYLLFSQDSLSSLG